MSVSVTSAPASYTALRTLLSVLSVLMVLGGLVLLFATGWLYGMIATPPGVAGETLMFLMKGFGVVVLAMSYLAFSASRDPVRNVAIINAFIITLVVVVALQIYEIVTGAADRMFPDHVILWSAIGRAILAGVLIWLRPRGPAVSA